MASFPSAWLLSSVRSRTSADLGAETNFNRCSAKHCVCFNAANLSSFTLTATNGSRSSSFRLASPGSPAVYSPDSKRIDSKLRIFQIKTRPDSKQNTCGHKHHRLVQSSSTLRGLGGVGSTVACESVLRSAGTLLSRVRAPLPAPLPDGGPESLRSPCCGLAIYKKTQTPWPQRYWGCVGVFYFRVKKKV
ncbi:hypothetical protein PoB_004517100 [Plakobranchus ocellatus]|uniref:Uncharacterized protein n=1 Tax=Plakobranchus ocellatus TaxID=259542 RepID=A0AAV4BE17_9GAST|nr:hypothetical protein PoB_004517100 [Plakobranchus ocellatus]